ncbi:MAG: four-carbon acid sugar kinase family protein [Alphaproteobacteria bacterium]|nr:four-carbon acid sugar kinase family protein [Alphaproteobacteria bacterium]
MSGPIALGVIADDFTGATDLAGVLVQGGMATVQTIGVPPIELELPTCDAVVVALKTRTMPAHEAIELSVAAARWLKARGARQLYFKVCSTFDSTDHGNIGPVADALLDEFGEGMSMVCPAYPANGRTVYLGHLFVGGALLSESPMRHHPLTPMTDANLVRVLGRQSRYPVALVPWSEVDAGAAAAGAALAALTRRGVRHAIADAVREADLRVLAAIGAGLGLLVGGAGLALGLPEQFRRARLIVAAAPEAALAPVGGGAAVLAGSCSPVTLAQVAAMARHHLSIRLDPMTLDDPIAMADCAFGQAAPALARGEPVLFFSTSNPAEVDAVQARLGAAASATLVERAFAELARRLVERGVRRLVVAGGETSGAVVGALGVKALAIGPQIDPGVPWTRALGSRSLLLALKSGNFGRPDFFRRALEMTQ